MIRVIFYCMILFCKKGGNFFEREKSINLILWQNGIMRDFFKWMMLQKMMVKFVELESHNSPTFVMMPNHDNSPVAKWNKTANHVPFWHLIVSPYCNPMETKKNPVTFFPSSTNVILTWVMGWFSVYFLIACDHW